MAVPTYGPAKYGIAVPAAIDPNSTQMSAIPTGSAGTPAGELLHPNNPMVALAVIGAVTFGLMAFSTSASVRVGRQRAAGSISIGDTK